ncbi:MAG: heme exporter protein CcmD [Caulobacteraceae bacterium]
MSFFADFGGKYAQFVWPAYLVSLLVFAWMIIDTLIRARHYRRRAEPPERNRERNADQ